MTDFYMRVALALNGLSGFNKTFPNLMLDKSDLLKSPNSEE